MTTVHVTPVDDLIAHATDDGDCVCVPTAEAVHHGSGSVDWVLVHHSLDGREHTEQAPRGGV